MGASMNRIVSQRDIKEVWNEYKALRSRHEAIEGGAVPEAGEVEKLRVNGESLRNVLMEHYLHLVRYNAERIHQKLPDEVELDDLMSSGIFGLMDAINGFDLDRGVKFETYCAPRIRGALLDEHPP